jgi:hypothetical protein
MGKIYAKLHFSFPYSFIFFVVTPLHFAHLYNLISCNSSQSIQNLDRVLRVSQIEREMCPWAISKYFGDLVSNTST